MKRLLFSVALGGSLALIGVAAAGSTSAAVAGSLVGTVTGTRAYIAVVVSAGTTRAYLCDGTRVTEWLNAGSTAGTVIHLRSKGGAKVDATLGASAATGTVTFPDGKHARFLAVPTRHVGGLYSVTVSADGSVRGGSATGGRITGKLTGKTKGGFFVTGAITVPHEEYPYRFRAVSTTAEPGSFRWILLNGKKRGENLGKGGGFTKSGKVGFTTSILWL